MIVHKFDPDVPAPGGIDTCIRGILRYRQSDEVVSIVGVGSRREELGTWRRARLGAQRLRFLPVTSIDPGNQVRRVPHAFRIALGLVRYRHQIPTPTVVQTHRADLALVCMALWPAASHTYFIHTQESGLLGARSDSFWRRSATMHRAVERFVVRHSDTVRVFNPDYAKRVAAWNSKARFSPTWWDPALVEPSRSEVALRQSNIVWVGRFERPKDPALAVRTFAHLRSWSPDQDWQLTMVGVGNLHQQTVELARRLQVSDSVQFTGRLTPAEVMQHLATSRVLLMTSVAGYEGYPRVLVEALAMGCSVVATSGADTGALVRDGINGWRAEANEEELARGIADAGPLAPADSVRSVAHLSAPEVIEDLYAEETPLPIGFLD